MDEEEIELAPTGRTGRTRGSRVRGAGFAAIRGVAVLAVAAVGYQLVVPSHPVERARLAQLVVPHTGIPAFDAKKPSGAESPASATGLAAMEQAAKRSPGRSGVYAINWTRSSTSALGVLAFLLPSDTQAASVLSQLRSSHLAAGSYTADSLRRAATFTVPGVPGSSGSRYVPATPASSPTPGLAVTAFRVGRVVGAVEVLDVDVKQADAVRVTGAEHALLARVAPGFSLHVVRYPVTGTVLWGVGAVLLAAGVSLGPVLVRRRRERRARQLAEEMARRVVVRGQTVAKRRR